MQIVQYIYNGYSTYNHTFFIKKDKAVSCLVYGRSSEVRQGNFGSVVGGEYKFIYNDTDEEIC